MKWPYGRIHWWFTDGVEEALISIAFGHLGVVYTACVRTPKFRTKAKGDIVGCYLKLVLASLWLRDHWRGLNVKRRVESALRPLTGAVS